MEVTKREIIISIAIAVIMLVIGFFISGEIIDAQNEKDAEYIKATHIDNKELFQYGMDTNIGNAFVYGDLQAVDTVTFDEIDGEYLHVEKIKKLYERHERKVTETDSDGKTHTKIKVYYKWETENRESKHSEKIMFCGIEFPYEKIPFISDKYIKTINTDREYSWKSGEYVKVKYEYFGTPIKHTGTIYTKLLDRTISDNTTFYENTSIDQLLKNFTSHVENFLFWVVWIILTIASVYGFCYLDNYWLED